MYEPDEIPQTREVTFFGHPFGLSTLFFTELWERFSYYGMRALLVLYMTAAVAEANGGLGMEVETATAIYGLYTFAVYALALPGGWVADRLLGQRKTVLVGGIIIALGHYTLAIDMIEAFYAGLILVVIGTGLLKPNVSAIVAELYPEGGARRDAGFSIFYMGINVGAMTGPLLCSYLGEEINWHLGFGAAGVGMTLGLIWYVWGARFLGEAGKLKEDSNSAEERASAWRKFFFGIGFVGLIAYILYGLSSGDLFPFAYLTTDGAPLIEFGIVDFAKSTGGIIVILAIVYFGYTIMYACRDNLERKRVGLIAVLFFGAAMFWSGFEQAGSSMTLFTEEHTDRVFFGAERPTGWFQAINPLFIIILAPVIGSMWVWLGARNPSLGVKFALGLILLGAGFLVMAWGASFTEEGMVSPMWLVVTYFLHTVGELCLSPVGLSAITKLSPKRLVGQMMGTWFMGAALGNLIAGLVAGYIESLPMDELFTAVAAVAGGCGLVFFLFYKPIRNLAGGVK